jgi:hypothetical protein
MKLINVGDQIEVREHHALGQTGRAAGIRKRRQSLDPKADQALGSASAHRLQQIGKRLGSASLLPRAKDAPQIRQPGKIDFLSMFGPSVISSAAPEFPN